MPRSKAVVYVRPTPQVENLSLRSRNGNRSSLVRSLIHSTSLDASCAVLSPRKATVAEAALAHSRHYLSLLYHHSREASSDGDEEVVDEDVVEEDDIEEDELVGDVGDSTADAQQQLEEAGLVDDCPVFPGLWELAMLTVGGAVVAAESLIRGDTSIACWFEGGRHHAAADSAQGFCYLNDVVVACKVLLSSPKICRVLYVDVDVHHGDGVENAFLYTDTVATLSLHLCEPGFYPNTGNQVFATRGSTRSSAVRVPLRRGIDDDMYSRVFTAAVDAIYRCHQPNAIVLQCGVDGICGDPLGGFNLTGNAYTTCVRQVLSYGLPTLILGGGGYRPGNAARVWTDVLECCVNETTVSQRDGCVFRPVSNARDIPLCDDFFEHYGPSFSRDIRPQRMKNENSEEELQAVIQKISLALDAARLVEHHSSSFS